MFLALYDRYFDRVLGYVRLRIRDDATCEDVTSTVFTTALAQLASFRGDGSFAGWLFQIARNRVIKFLVQARPGSRGTGGTDAQLRLEGQPDSRASLSAEFEIEYRQQLLVWAAGEIRVEFHDTTWHAFWRTCVEGQPVAEILNLRGRL